MTYISKRGKCLTTLPSISQVLGITRKQIIFSGISLSVSVAVWLLRFACAPFDQPTQCETKLPFTVKSELAATGALGFRYDEVRRIVDDAKLDLLTEPAHTRDWEVETISRSIESNEPQTMEQGDDGKKTNMDISISDETLLQNLVFLEAGNQDQTGMQLVCDVVLNRVDDPRFPNSISDVIFQDGQFGKTAEKLRKQKHLPITDAVRNAVASELSGRRLDGSVLYFSTSPVTSLGLYQHGAHYFSR